MRCRLLVRPASSRGCGGGGPVDGPPVGAVNMDLVLPRPVRGHQAVGAGERSFIGGARGRRDGGDGHGVPG